MSTRRRNRLPPLPEEHARCSPANTAAKNWARLLEHATHLDHLFPGIPRAEEIYSELKVISVTFRDDFFAVCMETSTQPCHLVDRFDFWNLFLGEINMELSEEEPGRIGLHYAPVQKNTQGKRVPYFLLHWLLKHHCCIKTLNIYESSLEYLQLVCDALHLSCGLEELVLGYSLDEQALGIVLSEVGTMPRTLVRLKVFAYKVPAYALYSLGTALQRVLGLASIDLSCMSMDACDANLLLSDMSACPSLAELSIKDYFLFPRGGAALAEFVAGSTALRKLCLSGAMYFEMKRLERFFKGLASNRSLEELHLCSFNLEKPAMDLLVEAVVHISTLKILDIDCFDEEVDGDGLAELVARNTGLRELVFGGCEAKCVATFSRAIRKNTQLQKLQLTLYDMEMQNYRELLTALSCNQSLQKLVLDNVLKNVVVDLCQLVSETRTEGRVKFPVGFEDALEFTCTIKKCSRLTQLAYQPKPDSLPLPRDAFSGLIDCHQLKSLTISECHKPIESECFNDLARFLSWTTTLKKAYLSFRTTAESTKALLDAILQNRSLSKLLIRNWTVESSDLQLLCDIIRTKKNLSELRLQLLNCKERMAVFLLAEHLWSNLNLLKVTVNVDPLYDNLSVQLRIRTATQRNLSMLRCAVQFVMGSHGRRYADAFEKVFNLPSLVETVQESANEPEEEAKEMVRSSKRYLDRKFLTVVGVVRDAVVCEPNGQVQLDGIGLDNWLRIRQYLRVADITPEPVVGLH
ncbi:uncharacterized protein LOC8029218 isoform X2 [Ixodes scapularis]|uniref:uncharacterized protein LOC8029218 isoform X2 n=1 Tax=Ixodes scapularis TaxID=6945 RepID=UPI001A9DA00D|nr:uncharacterized protein LOC8029218 isoform X2 [Ixodes scapularis]